MTLEPGLTRGVGFELPLCNLFTIYRYESPWMTLFWFDSPRADMGLHVKEGVKRMIFILNPNSNF